METKDLEQSFDSMATVALRVKRDRDALLEALKEISKGAGAYSRDPLEHAANCIANMKMIASEAIALAESK